MTRQATPEEVVLWGTPAHADGWYGMACWNGLSAEQQSLLIERGNLEIGYRPMGSCTNGATIAIESVDDQAPGPRFYCLPCAIEELRRRDPGRREVDGDVVRGRSDRHVRDE